MPEKKCPKCGKTFEESWQLCDECGLDLVVPTAGVGGSIPLLTLKIKDKLRGLDRALDSKMSKAVDTAEMAKESLESIGKQATVKATEISKKAEEKAQVIEKKSIDFTRRMRSGSSSNDIIDTIIDHPKGVLIAVVLISLIIGAIGLPLMMNNISGDMDIYLPQGDETAIILNEVNEDWSTDMMLFFVESPNKFDNIAYGSPYNITNLNLLNEISAIEEALDYNREDYGEEDRISFVLSISTLIKEINEAPKNIFEGAKKELEPPVDPGDLPGDYEYEIPQDQDEIDRIVAQIPEDTRKLLVIDTNDDGIWDSAGIIMGVRSDDQKKLMEKVYKLLNKYYIDDRVEEGDDNSGEEWWKRIEAGEIHCAITPTGPVPATEALTARTYQEFLVVLPAALLLIGAMLLFFHRTPTIILISGIPILCSLLITLGIMGLTGWVLTPQVVLVAPILLALGVAYGLYISNRYSDERHNIKDKKDRMRVAIKTTGKAVFLSAITTAVGFSSLMFVDMVPLKVLGFGLTVGIMVCYTITMLTVPSLVMLLNYKKKGKMHSVEKMGNVPIRHRKKIWLVALIIMIISLALVPSIEANMDLAEMAPHDEPTVNKMIEYSEDFGGGQMGMVLVRGSAAPGPNDDDQSLDGSMKDIEVLDAIDDMEDEFKKIEDLSPPISIVDVMKMIKIPEEVVSIISQLPGEYLPDQLKERLNETLNANFWDAIHTAGEWDPFFWHLWQDKSLQDSIINIFYYSITTEMRGFLVNNDYSKTLIYIDMPAMDAKRTETAVNEVNKVVENYPAGKSTSHLTGFAAIVVAVNNLLILNSLISLVVALVVVFFVLIIIFRSLRYAALTMIPVGLVVAYIPLTLSLTGIQLNLVTAMIGSIIVGIGIDFGIHMTERIRESGENFPGIKKAVETSGFTFVEATATIVAGMLSIFLINVRSIQEFITVVILLLVFSMIGAMLILPSIYATLSAEKMEDVTFIGETVEVEPE